MTELSNVGEEWSRIVRWLVESAPAHADALNPPASEGQIARAESVMGVSLPAELRQILKVNNGSTARSRSLTGNALHDGRGGGGYSPFPSNFLFCDVELICSLYVGNRKASMAMQEPGSRYEYWKEGWIPVFRQKEVHCGLFLDVSGGKTPAPVYEYEEESFPDLAFPSLAAYLSAVADALEGVRPFAVGGRRMPHLPTVRNGLICW
ncbi:SMI1/KNR4 family protein [Streptomyces sp. NPDC047000]|uniref:SMI1/KNR4 family protein n=1 Tax=Streptomyces sp. NPDC047000 TaxID=3155474 RepID=UPI0033F26405